MTTDTLEPAQLPGLDLAHENLYADGDPESAWALLRRECPVYWNASAALPGGGFWALTRYRDVVAVLKDPKTFTSAQGMRLDADPAATAAAAGKMLIVADAPRHGKIRRLISSAFTPRMAERLERNMRTTVRAQLDAALAAPVCELTEFAAVLPVSVICDLLGVPKSDWRFMLDATRTAFGESAATPIERLQAHAGILEYYADLVDFRRQSPGEDVISAMATGRVDGLPLTDEEIFLNCDGLISGGNETTRHAAVGGILALAADPDLWRLAVDANAAAPEGAGIAASVEEVLRYTSPAMHVRRTASRDVEFDGRLIRAGQAVTVWVPSANRDEEIFEHPEEFDPRRRPNNHVAFGLGPHFCLGAPLARVELRVLFTELFARVASVEPTRAAQRLRSNLIRGYESAPVRLHAREA